MKDNQKVILGALGVAIILCSVTFLAGIGSSVNQRDEVL